MARNNDTVPVDLNMKLNVYANEILNDVDINNRPTNFLDLDSLYYDTDQIGMHLNNLKLNGMAHEYSALHINIQSLPSKFEKLKLLISELCSANIHLDFILLCETFLTDNIANQFNLPGYNLIYKNRHNKTRGGVAIYLKAEYNFVERNDIAINIEGSFESIFIEIKSPIKNAIIGEIYRVPNTNETSAINMYDTILTKLQNYKNTVIIGTDQNFDYIKLNEHRNTQELLSAFLSSGLVPTITRPTRITSRTATLIDNIYLSLKHNSQIFSGILSVDISDHLPILTCFGLYKKPLTKEPLIINKRSINLEATNNISNAIKAINWQYLEHMNIDDAYLNFTQELTNILDKFAPETKISIPASCIIRDPWMSKGLLKSSKTLNKLHKQKLNKDKTHPTHIKYLQYRNMYNKLKRETKLTYYDDLFKKYKKLHKENVECSKFSNWTSK